MVIKVDLQKKTSLMFGWLAFFLLVIGLGSNYYFVAKEAMLFRGAISLIVILLTGFCFFKTITGQKFWLYWQEALIEVRKVVWPTKKETVQSTIGVLAMVLIMGIFLWSVDAVLVRLVAWLLQHNGV